MTGAPARMGIDLNADIAESYGQWSLGDDRALLQYASSANIACGFHAGDPTVIARACQRAVEANVVIGAHAGYRDLRGFGRRLLQVDPSDLADDLLYQLGALNALARAAGGAVGYFKPHGALYRAVDAQPEVAQAVVDAVAAFDERLTILHRPDSALLQLAARRGLVTAGEIFAHRAYRADGSLLEDEDPRARVTDPRIMAQQAVRLATTGTLLAVDGTVIPSSAVSVRIDAAAAAVIRKTLDAGGVRVRPFIA